MKKCLRVTAAPLLISTMLIGSLIAAFASSAAPAAAQAPTILRHETVQFSGYEAEPTMLNPRGIGGSSGFAFFYMYEPLFGVNFATGETLTVLGESIAWVDSTTIEIKIRPEAYWTDGQPITADDVYYSFKVYGLDGSKPWGTQDLAAVGDRMESFEIVDPKTIRFHIKPTYANSSVVWNQLRLAFNILPEHIWEQIEAEYGADIATFRNDWTAADFPEEWKVASGMYLPLYLDDKRTLMARNEDWWGQDVWGKLPAPKYLQHMRYYWSNAPAALDLQNNETDWCGNFVAGIDAIMGSMPNIHTYFGPEKQFFPETSVKLLVPNHRKYPLNENWLHRAIAMALDYRGISLVSSGYLHYDYLSEPGLYPSHLLPKDDAIAKALVRPELEEQYAIRNDIAGAIAILEEHCYKGADGRWYTNDGPSAEYLELYGDDAFSVTDADPAHAGINVPLGPWSIMDQLGWSDVLAIDGLACGMIKSIGIEMTQKVVDWGTNEADGHAFNYDFMHYVMHRATGTMYDRYQQLFVGTDYYWNHYGDYRNPTLVDLIDQLDTTTGAAQQAVADQIITIMGEQMPIIPFGGHPNWYIYNDMYWTGFPNAENNPIMTPGPYGGTATSAMLQKVVLGLQPTGVTATAPAGATVTVTQPGQTVVTTLPGGEVVTTTLPGATVVTTVAAPAETTWVWVGVLVVAVVVIAAVVMTVGRKGK